MVERLDETQRRVALQSLAGWTFDDASQTITKVFGFKDFSEAFGFMTRVALAAQSADHHPDWSNSYKKVTICLTTHDAGGLSDKDIALARAIDALVG